MKIEYFGKDEEHYIRNCIRTCQKRNHIQQVVFSTYHDCLTQICFTCNKLRTSINHEETKALKKGNMLLSQMRSNGLI
jgi:hypothetical protein